MPEHGRRQPRHRRPVVPDRRESSPARRRRHIAEPAGKYNAAGFLASSDYIPGDGNFKPEHDIFRGYRKFHGAAWAANITARIWGEDGSQLVTQTVSMCAGGHASFVLPDRFAATAGRRGIIQFQNADGVGLAGIGLRFNSSGGFTSMPTIFPMPLAVPLARPLAR